MVWLVQLDLIKCTTGRDITKCNYCNNKNQGLPSFATNSVSDCYSNCCHGYGVTLCVYSIICIEHIAELEITVGYQPFYPEQINLLGQIYHMFSMGKPIEW